jgi:hypothetical protein
MKWAALELQGYSTTSIDQHIKPAEINDVLWRWGTLNSHVILNFKPRIYKPLQYNNEVLQ